MSTQPIGISVFGAQSEHPAQVQVVEMLSQKAKYALRALLHLAEAPAGEAVLISEIATRHHIPKKFLEQILLDLKHHGVVQSWRGRSGGYALLKPASEISFGQVLRIIDGPLAPLPCLSRVAYRKCSDCEDESACALRRVFAVSHQATVSVLDRTMLADVLRGSKDAPPQGMPKVA
jgi:Rrf2 family protein